MSSRHLGRNPLPNLDTEEPEPADIQFLEDRLYEFNRDETGIGDGRALGMSTTTARRVLEGSLSPRTGQPSAQ